MIYCKPCNQINVAVVVVIGVLKTVKKIYMRRKNRFEA